MQRRKFLGEAAKAPKIMYRRRGRYIYVLLRGQVRAYAYA